MSDNDLKTAKLIATAITISVGLLFTAIAVTCVHDDIMRERMAELGYSQKTVQGSEKLAWVKD